MAEIEELKTQINGKRGLRRLLPGRMSVVALTVVMATALMSSPFQALAPRRIIVIPPDPDLDQHPSEWNYTGNDVPDSR
jgi:hypothetical protein